MAQQNILKSLLRCQRKDLSDITGIIHHVNVKRKIVEMIWQLHLPMDLVCKLIGEVFLVTVKGLTQVSQCCGLSDRPGL